MHCQNCKNAVARSVGAVPGLTGVEVDLSTGRAKWTDMDPKAPVSPDAVRRAVEAAGFDAPAEDGR
jgi:copper chaperone CopZ